MREALDRSLGGIGSDLLLRPLVPTSRWRQLMARPSSARAGGAHGIACDECGDHGPSATRHCLAPSAAVRYSVLAAHVLRVGDPVPGFVEAALVCEKRAA